MKTGFEKNIGKGSGFALRRLVASLLAFVQCMSLTYVGTPVAYADDGVSDESSLVESIPENEDGREDSQGGTLEAELGGQYHVTLSFDENAEIPNDAVLDLTVPELSEEELAWYASLQREALGITDEDIVFTFEALALTVSAEGETVVPQSAVEVCIRPLQADRSTVETWSAVRFDAENREGEQEASVLAKASGMEDEGCALRFETSRLGLIGLCSWARCLLNQQSRFMDLRVYGPSCAALETEELHFETDSGSALLEACSFTASSDAPDRVTALWVETAILDARDARLYSLRGTELGTLLSETGTTDGPVWLRGANGVALLTAEAAPEGETTLFSSDAVELVGLPRKGLTVNAENVTERFAGFDFASIQQTSAEPEPEPEQDDAKGGQIFSGWRKAARMMQSIAMESAAEPAQPEKLPAPWYDLIGAYDISLTLDDADYEPDPAHPFQVSITDPAINEELVLQLWHFHDDGSYERVEDFTVDGNTIRFAAESFSVYAVVSVTLSRLLEASDGSDYLITASFDSSSGLPSSAELSVTELQADDAGFEAFLASAAETLGEKPEGLALARVFDIGLYDPDTLKELEPSGSVQVSVSLAGEDLSAYPALRIVHFRGNDPEQAELVSASAEGEILSFDAGGFSVFVVAGYTVDFTYDGYTYNLAGGQDIRLSALFAALGIEADLSGSSASFSEDMPEGLVALTPVTGDDGAVSDWSISALSPFTTEHSLTVTLADGTKYIVAVTDADTNANSFDSLAAALNAARNGDTVVLTQDVSSTSELDLTLWSINNGDAITLDLGGHTLSLGGIKFASNAALTIQNGTLNADVSAYDGNPTIILGDGLTVNGNVTASNGAKAEIRGAAVNGSVTAHDGSFVTMSDGSVSGSMSVSGGGGLDVSGGAIDGDVTATNTSTSISGGEFGGAVTASGDSATITGGEFAVLPQGATISSLTITVTADSDEKEHDGTPLTKNSFTVSGAMGAGDYVESVTVTGSQTEVGSSENVPSAAVIHNETGIAYTIIYVNGTLTVTDASQPSKPTLTITTASTEKEYDGQPLTASGYTLSDTLAAGDHVENLTVTGNRTEIGVGQNLASGAVVKNSADEDVTDNYEISYVYGELSVTQRKLSITASSAEKEYDGDELTADGYILTSGSLLEGHTLSSVTVTGSQTNAGVCENVPSEAHIVDGDGADVTDTYYNITYLNGALTVTPVPVTLTANSGTAKNNNGEIIDLGYTCSVPGLVFADSVKTAATDVTGHTVEADHIGMYIVEPSGLTLGETTDTTGNYVVTAAKKGLLIIEGEEPILSKRLTKFEGNLAYYEIKINPQKELLWGDVNPFVLKDTFGTEGYHPQAINYGSVTAACEPTGESVTWDYSGYVGTFSIPDQTCVTIEYYSRVGGSAGQDVEVTNTAELGMMVDGEFLVAAVETVDEIVTIEPDIHGTGGVYTIGLYVYADGHMETGLPGAVFRLLDENMRPMTYPSGEHAGEEITFTTDDGSDEPLGYVTVGLSEETDGLAIHKNTVYYLEMVTAPYIEGSDVYYQKDNTYYRFLITDDPDYGGNYIYFNGDVLKVRCYPESRGVNVMKRFTGNYDLTEAEQKAIVFTLQKETLDSPTGWTDIESHTYAEFKYGTINFATKKSDLEDGATYRVVETNALPAALTSEIELNTTVSVTYQIQGVPVEDERGEFVVDQEDDGQVSFSFVFTNEYVDHRLSIVKVDELTGAMLPGAEFTVEAVLDEGFEPRVYTTNAEGRLSIKKADWETYNFDTLYSVRETEAPTGYILPAVPERYYFYFSSDGSTVPAGLPSGKTATDLSSSYITQAVLNSSSLVHIPVSVTWGVEEATGEDAWPNDVKRIVIGLYQSVGGAAPTAVTGEGGVALTATLTKAAYYDTTSFVDLPAQTDDGETITYSIAEDAIIGVNDADITDRYAQTNSISGTGWYTINNRDAIMVKIEKQWFQKDGVTPITDTSGKPAVSFDLYRLTTEQTGELTREQLVALLGDAVPVRTNLILNNENNWQRTLPMVATDNAGAAWSYYALERIPDNQIDSYVVTAAEGAQPRTLTIKNRQTAPTVTITAQDMTMIYGEGEPAAFDLTADVMEEGSTVAINGSGTDYTATVTTDGGVSSIISFNVTRAPGDDVGEYAITPSGNEEQEGYRVLFKPATLTILQAQVTITAGAQKVYGDPDPSTLVSFRLNGVDVPEVAGVIYGKTREEGEDVGEYPITLSGEADQGNYRVTFVDGVLTVTQAPVTVTAQDKSKFYGEDDPEFTAKVEGLKNDDSATVIEYELTRVSGENKGAYAITPSGEYDQGNYYIASFVSGTLTIDPAMLTVTVEDADKTYGEGDPEWDVTLDGLVGEDDGGELQHDDEGSYSYTPRGMSAPILSFKISRPDGENVGEYNVTPAGDADQGNYTLSYVCGVLSIYRAELNVTANDMVKAKLNPPMDDPVLTAKIEGWGNGDEVESTATSTVSGGVVTWTYMRDGVKILEFTLTREAGEDEGVYEITAAGEDVWPNYTVYYEPGVFSILSMFNIEVSQATVDPVTPDAAPKYRYKAEVDLTGTGLSGKYNDNDFQDGELWFYLPDDDGANLRTLRIPAGAKLTVTQLSGDIGLVHPEYSTAITLDGTLQPSSSVCTINGVDEFFAIKFTHNRITLPVLAMAAEGETEQGAQAVDGSVGFIGIPDDAYSIGEVFVAQYEGRIGYTLPDDKCYIFDHASLYASGGTYLSAVDMIRYNTALASPVWQYKTYAGDYTDVPDGAELRLYYFPKYICQIGDTRYYTLNAAMADAVPGVHTVIEMLIDYAMPASDAVVVPAGYDVEITTSPTGYSGAGENAATIRRSVTFSSGGLFTNHGKLTLTKLFLDGNKANVEAASCMVANMGSTSELTVASDVILQHAKGQNGAALYVAGGTVNIYGKLNANEAEKGAALYVAGGTVNLSGSSVTNNKNVEYGGALYITGGTVNLLSGTVVMNNAAGYGGAAYLTGGTLNVTGELKQNAATSGGAVFMTGGVLDLNGSVTGNTAENGGAVYMEGGAVTVSGGTAAYNTASSSGGLLYGTNGSVTVSGDSRIFYNRAEGGNGGAIWYGGGGSVTVSGGTLAGNEAAGNGGAICLSAGAATLSGGTIGDPDPTDPNDAFNKAVNGSAVFVQDGSASFSGVTVKNNRVTGTGAGGAVGVGSTTARLHFSGNTVVSDNVMADGNTKNNVFLDQDSALIINSPGLGDNANIGIYVSDALLSTRGDACSQFGTGGASTIANIGKFANDRSTVLKATYYYYQLIWTAPIKYEVRYLQSFNTFPPRATGTQLKNYVEYYPHSVENVMYDLVSEWTPAYAKSVTNYVYAYSFAKGAADFAEFLTSVDWDSANQKWVFKHGDTDVTKSTTNNQLSVYYSDGAYVSITNNSEHALTVDPLTVIGQNVVEKNYGYPTVVNYLTQTTLYPIQELSAEDPTTEPYVDAEGKLVIPSMGYVKLLFPGACGKAWSMAGVFTNASGAPADVVNYTLDSLNTTLPKQPLPAEWDGSLLSFTLSGTTLSRGNTYDILFEDPTPICKIVDDNATGKNVRQNAQGEYEHPFSTLNDAWDYIVEHTMSTATIEMLMDYQQPGTDVLNIPAGYDITLTTAAAKGSDAAQGQFYTYSGSDPTRATISRDNTNNGAAIIAEAHVGEVRTDNCDSALTVENLIFDGKALAKSGNGGAIMTCNNAVTVTNCLFKGYTADRGGALFFMWGTALITGTDFSNCTTGSADDKTGGGAIWSTAQVLTVTDCDFDTCSCTSGISQAGAVFHNIRGDGSAIYNKAPAKYATFPTGFSNNSKTRISGCTFKDCFAVGGSGGTVESDALDIVVQDCTFNGSYAAKESGANGGALNVYANDEASTSKDCKLAVIDCKFENCNAPNGKSNGGAIRTTSKRLYIIKCSFKDTIANTGGAVSMTNDTQTELVIAGTTFENCTAITTSGAVYTKAPRLVIGSVPDDVPIPDDVTLPAVGAGSFKNCTAPSYGGVSQATNAGTSSATVTNTSFESCVSSNSAAGALYSTAKTLDVTGVNGVITFKDCTATGNGGAVNHSGNRAVLTDCSFKGCESGSSGGGAYLSADSLAFTANNASFTDCAAVNNGGGLYVNAVTATITGGVFSGNKLSATESKGGALYTNKGTANLNGVTFSASAAGRNTAAYGGGVYQNGGTLYFSGGSISGCTALISGGGLYSAAACNLGDGTAANKLTVSGCYALTSGGGVYHSGSRNISLNMKSVSVTNCYAKQGGGVYSAADLTMSSDQVSVADCHAKNVTLADDQTPSAAADYASDNLGGGVYKSAGKLDLTGSALIDGCSAYDGGGLYDNSTGKISLTAGNFTGNTASHDGGAIYMNVGEIAFSGGSVTGNTAVNGGGLYKADGTFTMSGGVIGGTSADKNTASSGAGVYVADGKTFNMSGGSISYNAASSSGGGIAAGSAAVLTFTGSPTVRYNTMPGTTDGTTVDCNVYLDQDSNTVIKTGSTALSTTAYIGVYCSDDQDEAHGQAGMPFGTYNKTDNLNRFINDRRTFYYGMRGRNDNQIVWCSYVCMITDGLGEKVLYKDSSGTPAVYTTLENSGGMNSAFGTLAASSHGLYEKVVAADGSVSYRAYTGTDFQVQMLVEEYPVSGQIALSRSRNIKLVTASAEPDNPNFCGLFYNGDQKHPRATIYRSGFTNSMFNQSAGSIVFDDIIIDGGSEDGLVATDQGGILYMKSSAAITATIGKGALLCNSYTSNTAGGAIRMQEGDSMVLNLYGAIENCAVTRTGENYGGAISVRRGIFNMYSGSSITGCSAKLGGAVRVDTNMYMYGGTITGNNATGEGGGISSGNNNTSHIYFSGDCVVTGNTLNGTIPCNVQFVLPKLDIINAHDLDKNAEIGVYLADAGGQYTKHGEEGDPFGTWTVAWDGNARPYVFVNDRDLTGALRGSQGDESDSTIYWAQNFILTIDTAVDSDLAADHDTQEFVYTLHIDSDKAKRVSFSGVPFDANGNATLRMKDTDRPITIHFPAKVLDSSDHHAGYTLTVTPVDGFDVTADQNLGTYNARTYPVGFTAVTGTLGENLKISPPSGRSYVTFTQTRKTGDLTVRKTVETKDEPDKDTDFTFRLSLADKSINKTYTAVDAAGQALPDGVAIAAGEGSFVLRHGQAITIQGLPTSLGYTVTEDLSDNPSAARIRTHVEKDGGGAATAKSQAGTVGDHRTEEGKYASEIVFNNSFLEIICKITNRSDVLLYYKESDGKLVQAIFDNLRDAFDKINSGALRTRSDGSVSGLLQVKMVVAEYTMSAPVTLASGKTAYLTTAGTQDDEWPYKGVEGTAAVVKRGDFTDSMITDSGVLTLKKITLDGGSVDGKSADQDGGIVHVLTPVKLTVNADATLRNSTTTANGGAICFGGGASLTMNGAINNCAAASGGGIYAENAFASIAMYGTIADCTAETGDGGGLCAQKDGSITVYNGAQLTGNKAENGRGGAICTDSNLILRGAVGGSTEEGGAPKGNTARLGGGLCVDEHAVFTVYSTGYVTDNSAVNGGGLYVLGTARISGGTVSDNTASADGGGVCAVDSSTVTIAGASVLDGNKAVRGGAVYDGSTLTMSAGAVTGNEATQNGGAVFVAGGKSFTMSGGSINGGNKAPDGAVSTGRDADDTHAVLRFSGNAVVTGNTDPGGTAAMNVYLGYDSNDIIQTTGLGRNANIGVYVPNGENMSQLYKHGIADRNFGSYTGAYTTVGGYEIPATAYLDRFHNDRDEELDGTAGDKKPDPSTESFVMWPGKSLKIQVMQFDVQTDAEGKPVKDTEGNYVPVDDPAGVKGASFTLKNIRTEKEVWSGVSDSSGLVVIPWSKIEATGNNAAIFAENNVYELKQQSTGSSCVMPAGYWLVYIREGNAVVWKTVRPGQTVVISDDDVTLSPEIAPEVRENRTMDVVTAPGSESVLGGTFILYNDRRPTVTFDANGGKLYSGADKRTYTVEFGNTTSVTYDIVERNPTWNTIFLNWVDTAQKLTVGTAEVSGSTMRVSFADPDVASQVESGMSVLVDGLDDEFTINRVEVDGSGQRVAVATANIPDGSYTAMMYKWYHRGDQYLFYRHTDCDDLTLRAQWVPVVCKITDRDGNLLYIEGAPAIYATLETAVEEYNENGRKTGYDDKGRAIIAPFTNANGRTATARMIKMLVDTYELTEGLTLTNRRTCTLTTAGTDETQEDGYPFYSASGATVSTIRRVFTTDESMFTVERFNLALSDITLDGGWKGTDDTGAEVVQHTPGVDGGIVSVLGAGYQLYVFSGATLCNSATTQKGGAVYVGSNALLTVNDGTIRDNSAADGAGVYLAEGSTMNISGAPSFANNTVTKAGYEEKRNANEPYTNGLVEQDIYIDGYENGEAASLVVNGNLSGDVGSIWVWAEKTPHYMEDQQFALLASSVYSGISVFRNAQDDSVTTLSGSRATGEFLRGVTGDDPNYVYWGTEGMDLSFAKINGFATGEEMANAEFTLYKAGETTAFKTAAARITGTGAQTRATVLFETVPNGVYYLKETGVPTGYVNANTYIVLVGEANLRKPATAPGDGPWSEGGALYALTQEQIEAQRGSKNETTQKFEREYAIFLLDSDGKAVTIPDIAAFGVMNTSKTERDLILKKVNGDGAPLEGAGFRILRADLFEVKETDYGYDAAAGCYSSPASGVYFSGSLPVGKYYMVETATPAGYESNLGKVYELELKADGTRPTASEKGKIETDDVPTRLKTLLLQQS